MPASVHYSSMLVAPRIFIAALAGAAIFLTGGLLATQRQASSAGALTGKGFVLEAVARGGAVCLDYKVTQGATYGSCLVKPGPDHPVTTALSRDPRAGGAIHVYGTTVAQATAVEIVSDAGTQRIRTHALRALPGMRAFAAPPLPAGTVRRVTPLDAAGRPIT